MSSNHKSVQKVKRVFTQFSTLLVLGLGTMSALSILSDPLSNNLQANDGASAVGRGPASIVPLGSLNPQLTDQMMVWELNCQESTQLVSTAHQIRLKGKACNTDSDAQIINTSIQNNRNGYVATVFQQEQSNFTTDFIYLSKGSNELIITQQLSNGRNEAYKVTVVRE